MYIQIFLYFYLLSLSLSIQSIAADEQLFILYGPDYWCQDQFPITVLLAAVLGYNIDIDMEKTRIV